MYSNIGPKTTPTLISKEGRNRHPLGKWVNCVYNIFFANLHVKMNKRGDFDCMQPILRKILRETKHQNPLLYLKEVDYTDLQYDLSFKYQGEVNVQAPIRNPGSSPSPYRAL